MRSPVDPLLLSPIRSGGGTDSNGSAGLSAWGVVDGEAVAVRTVVADVQNSAANLSAAVAKEGMVVRLASVISAVKSMPNAWVSELLALS